MSEFRKLMEKKDSSSVETADIREDKHPIEEKPVEIPVEKYTTEPLETYTEYIRKAEQKLDTVLSDDDLAKMSAKEIQEWLKEHSYTDELESELVNRIGSTPDYSDKIECDTQMIYKYGQICLTTGSVIGLSVSQYFSPSQ